MQWHEYRNEITPYHGSNTNETWHTSLQDVTRIIESYNIKKIATNNICCAHTFVQEVISNDIITIDTYSRNLLFGGIVAKIQLVAVKRVRHWIINIKWHIIYNITTKCRLHDMELRNNPSVIVGYEYDHTSSANLNTSLGIGLREHSRFKRQPIHREMFLSCDTTNGCNNDKQTTVAAADVQYSQFY